MNWVGAWAHMTRVPVDRGAIVRDLRAQWYGTGHQYRGPAAMQWAYELDRGICDSLTAGYPPLSRHAAGVLVEAAMVCAPWLATGSPAGPPDPVNANDGIAWVQRNWRRIVEANHADEVRAAPFWWSEVWTSGLRPTAEWASQHPVMVFLAAQAHPGFKRWWASDPQAIAAQRRAHDAAVRAKIAAEAARVLARSYAPADGWTTQPQRVAYPVSASPYGGVVIPQSYAPGTFGNDYSGRTWWFTPGR